MKNEKKGVSRRRFLENTAVIGAAVGALGMSKLVSSCTSETKPVQELNLPPLLDQAPDGELLKAGLIGCGGRGTGAAMDFLSAGPNLTITAIGDVFQDRIDNSREELGKEKQLELTDDQCFVGFDAYQKVIDTDVDIIIMATPPYFRPMHFKAAIEARKHVFMEKPVAVDPVGVRSVMSTAKQADTFELCVVTGTQRHHQRDYIEVYKNVMAGTMGDIVSANAYWNGGKLWHRDNQPGWTEMEWMLRDWVNWIWLSGDHIVEQHIHNIDVINWFTGKFPVKAVGFGSRQRRLTGDQFDNFSVDFVYDGEVHMHSMCRQINDCVNNVSELIRGTKGYTNAQNTIWNPDGTVQFEYDYPLDESGEKMNNVKISPYVQEHIDLVTAIRTGQHVNEAERTAKSNLTAIMGRESAYTGKEVTWDEMMQSDLELGPKTLAMGPVDMEVVIPAPGSDPREKE
ncbi:MAG: Gfo/Idh/MocA family oxidoreductase [Bacteroidales bacterium]|nr:Gfo/Idh/MocA family oxidoreductase [Bacteroidales bacterium]